LKSDKLISIKNSIATRLLKIVFGLYLIIAIGVTASHMFMEYRYQKSNIQHELIDIQKTFEQALGINIWHLNHESLVSTLEGMLNLPAIAGITIQKIDNTHIAIGGIITQKDVTGEVSVHVNLLGLLQEEVKIHKDNRYNLDVFTHTFPILYTNNKKTKQLGIATLYSNTSVVFQRVKLGFLLLVINAVLKTTALWLIFLLVSTLLLRKPLGILTKATAGISMRNLGSFSVDTKTSGRNEIKILEEAMTSMVADLHNAILKRDETESSLRKSEQYLRSIFRAAPIGIGVSIDRKLVQLNEQMFTMTGYTKGELINQSAKKLYSSNKDFEKIGRTTYRQIQDHGTAMVETRWKRKNEITISVLVSSTPLDRDDLTKGVTFAALDITELKSAEFALRKSEKKYRTLFEKTSDAIFIVDKNSGKYIDANESALILTGRKWSELSQLTTMDIAPDRAENRLKTVKESKTTQELGQTEYIRPDGEKRIAILIAIPLGEDKVIGIARDITEERILNERLRQSQKMEAIGTLAGGIAHDFNNILSGIFGYSQLAQMNIKNPEKAVHDINQITKGAARAAELVQQILTFGRKTEYQKHIFNLYIGVNEALKLLRSTIPSTIEIIKKLDSQSEVYADPTRIHQVVMNLCTNAYHAMEKTGGSLTVSLTDVEVLKSKFLWDNKIIPGEYIKLEVSDTGIGMNKNELEKAFEPYFTTKGLGQGTGLGLALVHAIVDEHQGYLDIYSKPKKGTNFFIYFPKIKHDANNDTIDVPKKNQIKGCETIMVVDDEEPIRESCCAFLQAQGYKVETCANGIDALEKFKVDSTKFDLILTDLTMPGLTGDKLAIEILKIQPELPIILCTGFSEDMTEDKAIELGIKKFVQKPISNHELAVLIRKNLNKYSSA